MTIIKLYYHPLSRAADVVWMLEEVGVPYERQFVDFAKAEHKTEEFRKLNPMGKLPVIVDGEAIVSERAAIGIYLADRYSPGVLAPLLDTPERGTFLRWSLFAPSVIEPGAMAHAAGWEYRTSSAGWGSWDEMMNTLRIAVSQGDYLLGDRFTMADLIFGGTVRYLSLFNMLDPSPEITAYLDRLCARPAYIKADAINQAEREKLKSSS